MKRLIIAAPASGTGKTSIALGLMRAFRNRGMAVQPFKAGPDYIDTAFHSQACSRPSRNLDIWMQEPSVLKALFSRNAAGADICVIEGVMGLYDGLGHEFDNGSSAHLSRMLETPVIMVIDGRGVSTSAAALVKGFKELDPRVNLAGVIINRASGEKHYRLLQDAVESMTGVRCYGYIENISSISLESRHLGLIPSVETEDLEEKLELLAKRLSETVDIEGLLAMAGNLPKIETKPFSVSENIDPIRIGIAKDEAFNFYYEDNLDIMRDMGVEWVPFSPVHDGAIPENLGGIYIGGGFPEVFADRLSANRSMLYSVQRAAKAGMPIFAECGGFMYLMDSIKDFDGRNHPMCGVLKGTAAMTKRLQRFGYVTVELAADSILGLAGTQLKGHEFHRSLRENADMACTPAYKVAKGSNPEESWACGVNTGNVLAAYAHIHWGSNLEAAKSFAKACCAYASKEK